MLNAKTYILCLATLLVMNLTGCAGIQSFPNSARAGDTTAIAAGWKQDFSRDKITVTITPSVGSQIVLPPGDPAIRAVVNFYPDPLSSILVSAETGQDITPYAREYANMVNTIFTNGDSDWWQTTVFLDLPTSLPTGTTAVDISSTSGETHSSTLDIVPGTGQADPLVAELNGPLTAVQLASLERVSHYSIAISGTVIPHALQLDLSHDPTQAVGGSGAVFVVNPKGEVKNINWHDDGNSLRVLLTPASMQSLGDWKDFKFYVAGGVTGLQVSSVVAVDMNGNTITGISASVNAIN